MKGLAVVAYNFLNLPEKVTKGGDHFMNYYYAAAGRKLAQEVFTSATVLENRSDYSGEYFYVTLPWPTTHWTPMERQSPAASTTATMLMHPRHT